MLSLFLLSPRALAAVCVSVCHIMQCKATDALCVYCFFTVPLAHFFPY